MKSRVMRFSQIWLVLLHLPCQVSGLEMRKWMDELFPIIMDMLQDSSSLAKRQVRSEIEYLHHLVLISSLFFPQHHSKFWKMFSFWYSKYVSASVNITEYIFWECFKSYRKSFVNICFWYFLYKQSQANTGWGYSKILTNYFSMRDWILVGIDSEGSQTWLIVGISFYTY